MHIERMHKMIECLTEKALAQLENGIENVDTCEFGEVVDIIKDLNEAEYRAVIVKSMKEADEEEKEYDKELLRALKEEYGEEGGRRYYDRYRYKNGRFAPKGRGTYQRGYEESPYWHMTPAMYHNMEHNRDIDRNYGRMYYTEPVSDNMNMIESGYDKAKRHYTEVKEMHKANTAEDKEHKMKSLENYMKELSSDITELLADMTAEERTMLKSKLSMLVSKM